VIMAQKYIYQRTGGPLVVWGTHAPYQSRAADTSSLGSLGGDSLDAPRLPRPGAPEYIADPGYPPPMGGCGCSNPMGGSNRIGTGIGSQALGDLIGTGIGSQALGDLIGTVTSNLPLIAGGVALYFLFGRKKPYKKNPANRKGPYYRKRRRPKGPRRMRPRKAIRGRRLVREVKRGKIHYAYADGGKVSKSDLRKMMIHRRRRLPRRRRR